MLSLLLKNRKALRSEKTTALKITAGTLIHFFDMDSAFRQSNFTSIRENGRVFNPYHITSSDFQLLFSIFRVCDENGIIDMKSKRNLYEVILDDQEKPISDSQFYTSLHKFIQNGILSEKINNGVYELQINGFYQNKNTIDRIIMIPPFVFTKKFNFLPLPMKKLILTVYFQIGSNTSGVFERNYHGSGRKIRENIYSSLDALLHRTQTSHISKILANLQELTFEGISLFRSVKIDQGRNGSKAVIQIHPDWIHTYKTDQVNSKQVLPFSLFYKRRADRIQKWILQYELDADIEVNSLFINSLIQHSRKYPLALVKYALEQLKKVLNKGISITNSTQYIVGVIENKIAEGIKKIANQTGSLYFISNPLINSNYDQLERLRSFGIKIETNGVSRSKLKEKLTLLPTLLSNYLLPINQKHYTSIQLDPRFKDSLQDLYPYIKPLADRAYSIGADPIEFELLVEDIINSYTNNPDRLHNIIRLAQDELHLLPKLNKIPSISNQMDLFDFLFA